MTSTRRALALVSSLALASCLIAPDRPGDADAGAGGSGDGSVPGSCLTADDVAGPAIAVALPGSDRDTVFRGGVTGLGSAVVWRYDLPITNTRCPSDTTVLGSDAFAAASVPALTFATPVGEASPHLFALVSNGQDMSSIHDLVSTDGTGHYADGATITVPFAPAPIADVNVGPTPAFVTYVPSAKQLWVGGGSELGIADDDANTHTNATVATYDASVPARAWYGAAGIAGSDFSGVLVAQSSTYKVATSGSNVLGEGTDSWQTCGIACSDLISRAVSHNRSLASSIELMTIETDNGAFEQVDARGVVTDVAPAPAPASMEFVVDADLGDLAGDTTSDLSVLWAVPGDSTRRYLSIYLDVISTNPPVAAANLELTGDLVNATRVLVTYQTDAAGAFRPTVLLLSDHPGSGSSEACFEPMTPAGAQWSPCP